MLNRCSPAAIQGRQRLGQVSASNEADSPLAADAHDARNRTTSSCHHVCARRPGRGRGVGEDGQAQRPAPADAVADATEETAPDRPADQGTRPGSGAVPANVLIPRVEASINSATRGRRPGRKGACPGMRTASRARRRWPTSTGAARRCAGSGLRCRTPCLVRLGTWDHLRGVDGLIGMVPNADPDLTVCWPPSTEIWRLKGWSGAAGLSSPPGQTWRQLSSSVGFQRPALGRCRSAVRRLVITRFWSTSYRVHIQPPFSP